MELGVPVEVAVRVLDAEELVHATVKSGRPHQVDGLVGHVDDPEGGGRVGPALGREFDGLA